MHTKAVNRGFTLIELLVVVSIVAVLAALAAPSMRDAIERNAVSGHVNTFIGSLRYARAEAIRTGVSVVMCRSENSEAGNPTCAAGSGANGWASGWIIFVNRDLDASNNFNSGAGDSLLKVQGALTDSGGIEKTTAGTVKFVFRPTGLMSTGASAFTFNSASLTGSRQKLVCISMQGRARVLVDSFAACNSTDS